MKVKSIRQSATFDASPHAVYEMLMDSRQHSKFTGSKASISRKVGGKFTAFGGGLEGTHLELVPDKAIVQTWRANDWPAGHYSKATFRLTKVKSGTRLNFTQSGVPVEHYAGISDGWRKFYWVRMKAMLAASG